MALSFLYLVFLRTVQIPRLQQFEGTTVTFVASNVGTIHGLTRQALLRGRNLQFMRHRG